MVGLTRHTALEMADRIVREPWVRGKYKRDSNKEQLFEKQWMEWSQWIYAHISIQLGGEKEDEFNFSKMRKNRDIYIN